VSASAYLDRIASMVELLQQEQLGRIEEAADLVADALRRDAIVHVVAVRPDALLPGHGPFPLRDAHEHIERAHRTFESMVPPPQILQ
jgi:hypothetical protein